MKVSLFDFTLPEELIAAHPCDPRDACRLLHVARGGEIYDRQFRDLLDLLHAEDVLVINDSKVIPARLFVTKAEGSIELLLHQRQGASWRCFARPAKKLKIGDALTISDGFSCEIKEKLETGEVLVEFNLSGEEFWQCLDNIGHMPLPPYMKRCDAAKDREAYQTVYARERGSVAAPTAGLHFTAELLAAIEAKGVQIVRVTLHVGAGTFQPVKVEDTTEHVMHREWAEISPEAATKINQARAAGGRVVAVGTTALRILETVAAEDGALTAFSGETGIFITPSYRFKLVDALITNFHLPKSTLFMLVCAFSGLDLMQKAYQHAIKAGYRFYSYGDACFLECCD